MLTAFLLKGKKKEKQFLRGNVQTKLKFLSNFSSDYNIFVTITTFLLYSKSVIFFYSFSPIPFDFKSSKIFIGLTSTF